MVILPANILADLIIGTPLQFSIEIYHNLHVTIEMSAIITMVIIM